MAGSQTHHDVYIINSIPIYSKYNIFFTAKLIKDETLNILLAGRDTVGGTSLDQAKLLKQCFRLRLLLLVPYINSLNIQIYYENFVQKFSNILAHIADPHMMIYVK